MILLQRYIGKIACIQQSSLLFVQFQADGKGGIPLALFFIGRCVGLVNINDLRIAFKAAWHIKKHDDYQKEKPAHYEWVEGIKLIICYEQEFLFMSDHFNELYLKTVGDCYKFADANTGLIFTMMKITCLKN